MVVPGCPSVLESRNTPTGRSEGAVLKIVVVGAGEVGYHFAEWLSRENKEVVVIDTNAQPLQWILEHLDVQTLHGSGSNPRILEEAGLKDADILLAVTDRDEVNLVACFFANIISPGYVRSP